MIPSKLTVLLLAFLFLAPMTIRAQSLSIQEKRLQHKEMIREAIKEIREAYIHEQKRLQDELKRHDELMLEASKRRHAFFLEVQKKEEEAIRNMMLRDLERQRTVLQWKNEYLRGEINRHLASWNKHRERESQYYRELLKKEQKAKQEKLLKTLQESREVIRKENDLIRKTMEQQYTFYNEHFKTKLEYNLGNAKTSVALEQGSSENDNQ